MNTTVIEGKKKEKNYKAAEQINLTRFCLIIIYDKI